MQLMLVPFPTVFKEVFPLLHLLFSTIEHELYLFPCPVIRPLYLHWNPLTVESIRTNVYYLFISNIFKAFIITQNNVGY